MNALTTITNYKHIKPIGNKTLKDSNKKVNPWDSKHTKK